MVTTLVWPSASRTICMASESHASASAWAKASRSCGAPADPPARTSDGVVRARATVDDDAIEGRAHRSRQHLVERCGFDGRVGGEDAEHRGHVRSEHGRALRHATDRPGVTLDDHLLRDGVGGHDRPGRGGSRLLSSRPRLCQLRDAALERCGVERDADETGRADEHVVECAAELLRGPRTHLVGDVDVGSGRAVGVAAVQHDRRGATTGGREMLTRRPRTGPAQARFWVNTPAAETGRPSAVATSDKSGAPDSLMPQCSPAATNPWGAVTLTGTRPPR